MHWLNVGRIKINVAHLLYMLWQINQFTVSPNVYSPCTGDHWIIIRLCTCGCHDYILTNELNKVGFFISLHDNARN